MGVGVKKPRAQFPALQPAWPCSCSAASQRPSSQAFIRDLIQAQHFHIVLESSSPTNRARLLSMAAPHASSWLSMVPSPGLGLHLVSMSIMQICHYVVAGVGYFQSVHVPFCPDTALAIDPWIPISCCDQQTLGGGGGCGHTPY